MDYKRFYSDLFAPLVASIGSIDRNTIFAIMGFDGGGPLNFSTIGIDDGVKPATYISCELAVRQTQVPAEQGGYRYELLTSCDEELWVRRILTNLGRMPMEVALGHGHTVDIGSIVNERPAPDLATGDPPLQGVLLQEECTTEIELAILR